MYFLFAKRLFFTNCPNFLANQDPKATHQNEKVYNLDECVKTLLSGVKKCEETKDFVKIVFEGNREKLKLVLH